MKVTKKMMYFIYNENNCSQGYFERLSVSELYSYMDSLSKDINWTIRKDGLGGALVYKDYNYTKQFIKAIS